jgi:HMG (high mobility group) box
VFSSLLTSQARLISAAYKELSPEEVKKYENMAKEEKARYANEMKDYVAPEMSDDDRKTKKAAPKKAKKDPNAPKKPMSAYMLFSNHIRATVKAENPSTSFGEVAKLISEKYKQLTDQEMAYWNKKADDDKKRYSRDMITFSKADDANSSRNKQEEEDDNDDDDVNDDDDDDDDDE